MTDTCGATTISLELTLADSHLHSLTWEQAQIFKTSMANLEGILSPLRERNSPTLTLSKLTVVMSVLLAGTASWKATVKSGPDHILTHVSLATCTQWLRGWRGQSLSGLTIKAGGVRWQINSSTEARHTATFPKGSGTAQITSSPPSQPSRK